MKNILKTTSAILLGAVILTGTANAKVIKKANTLPSYKINSQLSIPQLKLNKNTFITDYKYMDVNGDKVKDNVILTGVKEKKSDMYLNDINIIVQDGKTKKFTKTSIGKDSGGYAAKMFLGDFNGDKIPDVLVSMPTGGSGGIVEYGLVSFKGNAPKALFDYKKFNGGLALDVKFLPDFKVELKSKSLNKTEVIDVSSRKDNYIGSIYDKDGKIKENVTGWVDGFCELKPVDVDKNGIYELQGLQGISGSCHADRLGYLTTTWKWDGKNIKIDANNVKLQQEVDNKEADVNGDGTKDFVNLSGMRNFGEESPYMTNINLQIYDAKTSVFKEIPAQNANEGYEPKVFIGDFNGDKSQDMLISIANGGSGGMSTYSLISYKGNKITNLFDQDKFSRGLDFNVVFKDGFKADVIIKDTNKSYTIDVSANKEMYIEDGMYNKDGKLIRSAEGMMNGLSELNAIDIDKDGNYELVGYQRICGTANADTLGYVKSTWKVDNSGVKLVDVTASNNIDKNN